MPPAAKAPLIGGLKLPSGEVTKSKRSSRSLRRRNAVIACSFDLAGKRVLDVGCADGLHSLYMANTAREVWGIDHRDSEIQKGKATARALGITNVRFETGDIRDPDLFKDYGKFDLAIAWGFLHRIGDIFSLLYTLEPLADALSLEWRTPVFPMMSSLSLAYHPPGRRALDPMNVNSVADALGAGKRIADGEKIEGDTAFWEPTPGAIKAIAGRLGYTSQTLIGYGENLMSEAEAIARGWNSHMEKVAAGKASIERLPRQRVHMLFERKPGSITLKNLKHGAQRIPEWDHAMMESLDAPKRKGKR
jgi:SAM-dependent methyltransferase